MKYREGLKLNHAKLLSGIPVAEKILKTIKFNIKKLKALGITPGLGTILVGDDPASANYVNVKHKTCKAVGIQSFHTHLPASTSKGELMSVIAQYNQNPAIDSFLIQYPIPAHLNYNQALEVMDPNKDADGLHPTNLGRLVLGQVCPLPCAPAGILAIFNYYGISIEDKNLVILGRGPTLGRPLSILLSSKQHGANANITLIHSKTKHIERYTMQADILVSAVGSPAIIKPNMVKPGVVVISSGITIKNRVIIPDVDEQVSQVASWITPRIGGVGPTTVAMLLKNTVEAAERKNN